MTEFKSKETATAHKDDRAVSATLMEGYDREEDRTFQFVQLAKGQLAERETPEGDVVEVFDLDDGPGEKVTVGSPEFIEPLVEALEELDELANGD